MVERTHVDERRRANLQPVGTGASVAHDKEGQFAFRRFRAAIGFTLRRLEALRENYEVMNQAFHVSHDVWLRRRDVLGDISHDWTRRHLLKTLLDDPRALAHFLHADPVSIVGVAVL